MIFILTFLAWVSIAMFLAWVVEPFLRLRCGFHLAEDSMDEEMVRFCVTVFWPIFLPIFLFTRFIIFPTISLITKINEKSEKFWEPKPEVISYPEIDESKSNYRSVSFKD